MKEWKNERMKECMNEWMIGWVNECMNEGTNDRTNEWMKGRINECFQPHRALTKAMKPKHFFDLIFQKCSVPLSYFNMFKWKSSSRYSPVRFLSATFPNRAAHPRKQRPSPSATKAATLPEKNTGFRARERFQAWIQAFPISYTSQLLDDDVVMMMWLTGWLTWWCGCHDGEKAGHDNRP